MQRIKHILARWGLLAVGLLAGGALAGGALALHSRPTPTPTALPAPNPAYNVGQVLDGLRSHQAAWLGHAFWVRGLWFDTCGYHSDPVNLSKPGAIGGPGSLCVMASPGEPENGLADKLVWGTNPGGTFLAVTNALSHGLPGWQFGGPLNLDKGVAAYYRVRLSVESPCTLNDGGTFQPGGPVPPDAKPCVVGTVIEARR